MAGPRAARCLSAGGCTTTRSSGLRQRTSSRSDSWTRRQQPRATPTPTCHSVRPACLPRCCGQVPSPCAHAVPPALTRMLWPPRAAGLGPRNCIGWRFAVEELHISLVRRGRPACRCLPLPTLHMCCCTRSPWLPASSPHAGAMHPASQPTTACAPSGTHAGCTSASPSPSQSSTSRCHCRCAWGLRWGPREVSG